MNSPHKGLDIPIVRTGVGSTLSFATISHEVPDLSQSEIRSTIERQLIEHKNLFGTEPFTIEYSAKSGLYELRPNSVIGRLNCGRFILEIGSKFPDIEIGKWLRLAHVCGSTHLVKHYNDSSESSLSDQDELQGLDYFALAFISSVFDCVNDGLLSVREEKIVERPELRGRLLTTEFVRRGANPLRPVTAQSSKSIDCSPNAVLKVAIELCIAESQSSRLRGLADNLLGYFSEVNTKGLELDQVDYEFVSSLPRVDYERALALAKVIIEGFQSLKGDNKDFLPFFTIDLDKLFEDFVSFELKRLLKSTKYNVEIQPKFPHKVSPELKDKYISPDILVGPVDPSKGKLVILDTKNKYSIIGADGKPNISNADIFQMGHYCQTLGTDLAILIYPGTKANFTKYPLMVSEGAVAYGNKRKKAFKYILENGENHFRFEGASSSFSLIIWRVDLQGHLKKTRESLAQLCQFTADCINEKVV